MTWKFCQDCKKEARFRKNGKCDNCENIKNANIEIQKDIYQN